MFKGQKRYRTIWPLLMAFALFVVGGMGVGSASADETDTPFPPRNDIHAHIWVNADGTNPDLHFVNGSYLFYSAGWAGYINQRVIRMNGTTSAHNAVTMTITIPQTAHYQARISDYRSLFRGKPFTLSNEYFISYLDTMEGEGSSINRIFDMGLIEAGEYTLRIWNPDSSNMLTLKEFRIEYSDLVPPTPPPPPPAPIANALCYLAIDASGAVISATDTLTNVTTITGTVTITGTTIITTPANLVINPSFELTENNILPSYWQFEHALVAPSMWQDGNGGKIIRSNGVPRHELRQSIPLPPSPAYLIGMDIDYASGTAPVRWVVSGVERWSHGTATDGWQVITDTYNLTGELGSPGNDNTFKDFQVILPDTAALGDVAIDNLHLVPVEVDESGNPTGVYCTAVGEAYAAQPPPEAPVDPTVPSASQSAWGLVLPVTNSGGVCFECHFPTGQGAEAAIAWLGCILRNLFGCDLRGWLNDITNAVLGVWAGQNGIALWWHGTINGWVNWAAGFGLAWASSGIEAFNNYAAYLNSITSVTGDSAAVSRSLLAIGDVAPEDQPLLVQMFTLWLAPFFLDWATTSITAYNNYVEYLNTVPTTFVIMIDGVAGGGSWAELIYELLRGLFMLVAGLIMGLIDGLAQIVNLIMAIMWAIWSSWSVEPLTLQEFTTMTYGSEVGARFDMDAPPVVGDAAAIAAADVANGQMIYFMWGLAAVDSVFMDFRLFWIPVLASAAVVWTTFMWFISRWDVLLPNF